MTVNNLPPNDDNVKATFGKAISTIRGHFPHLEEGYRICASVIATCYLKDAQCCGLIFVGQPSCGKTTLLRMFTGTEFGGIVAVDKITPASFLSGYAQKKEKDLQRIDLIRRLPNKTLVVKELSTLFSGDTAIYEAITTLTRVLDGEGLVRYTAVHGERSFTGDVRFCMIGAITQLSKGLWRAISIIGPRMLQCPLKSPEKRAENYLQALEQCTQATREALLVLHKNRGCKTRIVEVIVPEHLRGLLWKMARTVATLRSVVPEDEFVDAEPEDPARVAQMLTDIACGHALLNGRREVTLEDLNILHPLIKGSVPPGHWKVFSLIRKAGPMTAQELKQCLRVSKSSIHRELNALERLGVLSRTVRPNTGAKGKPPHRWVIHKDWEWAKHPEFSKLVWGV